MKLVAPWLWSSPMIFGRSKDPLNIARMDWAFSNPITNISWNLLWNSFITKIQIFAKCGEPTRGAAVSLLASYARMMLPSVWSSLFSVNKQAFGTLVSLFILIFFSPSNKRNDSKAGGAFILETKTCHSTASSSLNLLFLVLWRFTKNSAAHCATCWSGGASKHDDRCGRALFGFQLADDAAIFISNNSKVNKAIRCIVGCPGLGTGRQ